MYTSMIFMKQKLEEMTLAFESALADNVALKQDPRASPGIPPPSPLRVDECNSVFHTREAQCSAQES